jgi:hypothetical protein
MHTVVSLFQMLLFYFLFFSLFISKKAKEKVKKENFLFQRAIETGVTMFLMSLGNGVNRVLKK